MLDCHVPKNEERRRKQECTSLQIVDSLVKNDPRKNGGTHYEKCKRSTESENVK